MEKFTDAEIIKALECCIKSVSLNDCEDLQCPACDEIGCYFMRQSTEYYPESLIQEMGKAVLDLITRQKAEIESLKHRKTELQIRNQELQHEKSEAIKEFAERLKEHTKELKIGDNIYLQVVGIGRIDNLVKEMIGEQNE